MIGQLMCSFSGCIGRSNIRVDNAEAAFIRERATGDTQNKSLSEVEQSKQTVKFLKMDLKITNLASPRFTVAKNTIILAEEE